VYVVADVRSDRRRWSGLDGLRAVAVAAVVAFHFAPGALHGGFLGVDIFFVLSGFLITDLLVARYDRTGRLDLAGFWTRRARRLLPALAVMLVVVTAAATVIEPGQEVFRQGDLGDRIYAILEGEAEVVIRDQVVARLGAGELFGEMALLDHTTRSATIRCATPLSVWSLPKKELELLAQGMPELRRGLEQLRERRARPMARPA